MLAESIVGVVLGSLIVLVVARWMFRRTHGE